MVYEVHIYSLLQCMFSTLFDKYFLNSNELSKGHMYFYKCVNVYMYIYIAPATVDDDMFRRQNIVFKSSINFWGYHVQSLLVFYYNAKEILIKFDKGTTDTSEIFKYQNTSIYIIQKLYTISIKNCLEI